MKRLMLFAACGILLCSCDGASEAKLYEATKVQIIKKIHWHPQSHFDKEYEITMRDNTAEIMAGVTTTETPARHLKFKATMRLAPGGQPDDMNAWELADIQERN